MDEKYKAKDTKGPMYKERSDKTTDDEEPDYHVADTQENTMDSAMRDEEGAKRKDAEGCDKASANKDSAVPGIQPSVEADNEDRVKPAEGCRPRPEVNQIDAVACRI